MASSHSSNNLGIKDNQALPATAILAVWNWRKTMRMKGNTKYSIGKSFMSDSNNR